MKIINTGEKNHQRNNDPISCVVPTRNGEKVIGSSLSVIANWLDKKPGSEILVFENGSSDSTLLLLESIKNDWKHATSLHIFQVNSFGDSLREGAKLAKNARLVLTADDLPFELNDWEGFDFCKNQVAIARKTRRINEPRDLLRFIMTKVFLVFRLFLLKMNIEVNGTIQLTDNAIRYIQFTKENSMSITLELMFLLSKGGFPICEIPVDYEERNHKSRVRPIVDGWLTLQLLVKLRRSYKKDFR
jgi:glycosyltransferase involved in cell wall biosynthesis